MFFSPYYRAPEKSFVRVFHASPDAPAVDVYLNDQVIARNLSYRQFTPYVTVAPGVYNVRVFAAGTTTNPVINTNYNFRPNVIETIAATGRLNDIELIPYQEQKLPQIPGKSYIRFIHLSPNTPAVDITLPNGNVLFRDITFEEASEYIPVNAGTYTLQARPTGTTEVVLNVPNVNIKAGRYYTVYAIGLLNETPALQVVIPLDGNSYIEV